MNKGIIIGIIIVILLIGGFFLFGSRQEQPETGSPTESRVPAPGFENVPEAVVVPEEENHTHVVTYTDSGFNPQTINIEFGEELTFINESSQDMWPATAMHPTHRVYPGSDIAKCNTVEARTIFDACKGIAPGGSWEFTFNQVGSWKYHDHLNISHFGTIVVE